MENICVFFNAAFKRTGDPLNILRGGDAKEYRAPFGKFFTNEAFVCGKALLVVGLERKDFILETAFCWFG